MTYSEFANLGIGYMCSSNLNGKNNANQTANSMSDTPKSEQQYSYSDSNTNVADTNTKDSTDENTTDVSKDSYNYKSVDEFLEDLIDKAKKKKNSSSALLENIKKSAANLRKFFADLAETEKEDKYDYLSQYKYAENN